MGSTRVVGNQMILVLDGHEVGTVKYLSGGRLVSSVTDEAVGENAGRIRHSTTLEVEPFVVEAGVLREVNTWIGAALSRQYSRRTFELRHGSRDKAYSQESFESLLTEIGFPVLDRRAGGEVMLKLKVQPERLTTKSIAGQTPSSPPILPFSGSHFRLTIPGVLDGSEVQKIEAFTIKEGVKKLYTGEARFPQIEPTRIDFPHLVFTLATNQAKRLSDWHEATTNSGTADSDENERTGQLELFSRGNTLALTINLSEMGIASVSGEKTPTTKAELYVGNMGVEGSIK